jgi:hypothetical protein
MFWFDRIQNADSEPEGYSECTGRLFSLLFFEYLCWFSMFLFQETDHQH